MSRKTNRAAFNAIQIHTQQSQHIADSEMTDEMKIIVLKSLNHSLESLLLVENCYHGYSFPNMSQRMKQASEDHQWDQMRGYVENYHHNYGVKGYEGDRHLQLDLSGI